VISQKVRKRIYKIKINHTKEFNSKSSDANAIDEYPIGIINSIREKRYHTCSKAPR